MSPFVLGSILSPLENALHDLLFGIQHATGLPWAWSIIVLTVCVRLAILPLAIIQMRSMRGMQKIAPELQKLKAKHKGDNQKLQAEMMAIELQHHLAHRGSPIGNIPHARSIDVPDEVELLRDPEQRAHVSHRLCAHGTRLAQVCLRRRVRRSQDHLPCNRPTFHGIPHGLGYHPIAALAHRSLEKMHVPSCSS